MQLNPYCIQHSERRGDSHRDCSGGNQRHANGQQNYGHQDYRAYGEQEFTLQILDPRTHYRRLVGNQIELQVGRKQRPDPPERLVDLFAELDNISSFLHFHGKQDAGRAIEARDLIGILVTAFHAGEISDVNRLARGVGNIHQDSLNLTFGEQQAVGPHRNVLAGYQEVAGILNDVALLKRLDDPVGVGKILRDPLQAAGDPDLLTLLSVAAKFGDVRDGAQFVFDALDVVLQFTVSVTIPVNCNQQRDGVAKIRVDDRPDHSGWKFTGGPGLVQVVTKFGPELVAVLHVVLQFDIYKEISRPAGRIRFLLPNFGKLE